LLPTNKQKSRQEAPKHTGTNLKLVTRRHWSDNSL